MSNEKQIKKTAKCPKCGNDKGLWANGTFSQYYDWNGEPRGYCHNSVAFTAYCLKCGYKTDTRKLRERSKNGT